MSVSTQCNACGSASAREKLTMIMMNIHPSIAFTSCGREHCAMKIGHLRGLHAKCSQYILLRSQRRYHRQTCQTNLSDASVFHALGLSNLSWKLILTDSLGSLDVWAERNLGFLKLRTAVRSCSRYA